RGPACAHQDGPLQAGGRGRLVAGSRTSPVMSAASSVEAPRRPAWWLQRPRDLWSVTAALIRSRNAAPELAADRVVRRFGLVIGLVGTIAAVLELPEIIVQHRPVPLAWTVITFAVAFGMLPVLAVVSLIAGARQVRVV